MLQYGLMLDEGDGVEVDKKEALRYIKMAADQENTIALHKYNDMLAKGYDA